MNARMCLPVVAMLCSVATYAQSGSTPTDWWYELDMSYSEANPDYKPFPNGEGETLHGRLGWKNWQGFVRYANAEFQPSGEVAGGTIKDWWAVGAAYRYELSSDWVVRAGVSIQELTRVINGNEDTENGHEFAVGTLWQPLESLRFGLDVGVMDVVIDDWSLHFEARYQIQKPVYLVARLRDYADFDLTYYEAGLGLAF